MFQMVQKLKKCKRLLVEWSIKAFPNNRKIIDKLLQKIDVIQNERFDDEGFRKVVALTVELEKVWLKEEKYWFQRSRIKWLNFEDRNTKFFHQSIAKRRRQNKIFSLKGNDGSWVEDKGKIHSMFVKFYEELFRSGGERNWEEIMNFVPKLVVSRGVIEVVQSFFHSGRLLRELNMTDIVLIPKVKRPEDVSQFRPISCCNFAYKIISKVMVNRLKPFMGELITENQSAFMEKRWT
ncbi:hypothetical protein PTKIN_Ptkin03bG0096000 [Pterospermum kingtungense]